MEKHLESITLKKCMEADRPKITLKESELLYIKDKKMFYFGDGITKGGLPLTEHNFSKEAYEKLSFIILSSQLNLDDLKSKTSDMMDAFYQISNIFNSLNVSGIFDSSATPINPESVDSYKIEDLIKNMALVQYDLSKKMNYVIQILSSFK